jgi:hypothetical protein
VPQFASGKLGFTPLIPLLKKVADKEPDVEIWTAVYELITPSTPTNIKKPASHVRTLSTVLRALQKDWNNTYFPHSLVALRDLVRQYQLLDVNQYYAKTLVFVQSSGMGKSRLADAFGQHCPMINFILRDYGTSGFPPPDEDILSFLRHDPPSNIPGPTSQGTSKETSEGTSKETSKGKSKEISEGTSKETPDETSSDFLKRRAAVAWNHTLAAALLQASFETCKLPVFFAELIANSNILISQYLGGEQALYHDDSRRSCRC